MSKDNCGLYLYGIELVGHMCPYCIITESDKEAAIEILISDNKDKNLIVKNITILKINSIKAIGESVDDMNKKSKIMLNMMLSK